MNKSDPLAGWHEPGDELVQNALSRVGDPQHRRVFFDRLNNPRWVAALDRRHAFDSPPQPIVDELGAALWTRWPEGEYLVRMAPLVPIKVSEILTRVSTGSNPFVRDVVIQAAANMPASEAQQFVAPIERYLQEASTRNGRDILALIEHFADAGMEKQANRMAQAAFRPRAVDGPQGGLQRRRNVIVGVARPWYEELLPSAISALHRVLGDKVLKTVAAWLEAFQQATDRFDAASGEDHSYIWRPAIEEHEQNRDRHEIGDALVRAVRDRALADVRNGRPASEVRTTLERGSQPLLTRIGLYVLAATAGDTPETNAEAFERLLETRLFESRYRHEYVALTRAALPLADDNFVNAWESLVLDGPPIDSEQLVDRVSQHLLPDEQLDEGIERYREVWRLNLLSGIGMDALPARSAVVLRELTQKYGEPQHPNFPSYMTTSWVGPDSPISADELSDMSVGEVLALLTEWEPDSSDRWGPSKEGLARAFQDAASSRANEFSRVALEIVHLDPTYVRAYFSGLTAALDTAGEVDWAPVLDAARVVASMPDDGAEVEGSMNEDVVWRFAQREVASLVGRGSSNKPNSIPAELLSSAIEAIAALVNHSDPIAEHEEAYGESHMDPLTLSLNTTRPAAIRAIAQVASRARSLSTEGITIESTTAAITSAMQLLETRLIPDRDESLAVAAAFGEALGRLIWADKDWTKEHAEILLSDDSFGDVVLSTALATYHASLGLIDFVESPARVRLDRVSQGGSVIPGWKMDRTPIELIGDHLLLLRVQDVIDINSPLLQHFFATAPITARARVLGHLGWQIMQSEDVPPETLERAKQIWDHRANAVKNGQSTDGELSEFYWWVHANKFEPSWWLPHLLQASASDEFDTRGMLGEELEAASVDAPGPVVEILERLLARHEEPLSRYDLVQHAPGIIASALESGDDGAIETGRRVMDLLGRSGHIRIADLVKQRGGIGRTGNIQD